MKISIIILNYNGRKDTLDCLKTVKKLEIGNSLRAKASWKSEIIIVDNNSSDGSVKSIKKSFPKVKIIENKQNLGFSEGNNIGIRYALKEGVDYIMLLNNDTLVKKDLLIQLSQAINKDKKNAIVSPKIYFASGYEFHKKRYKKNDRGKVIWYAGGRLDWNNVLASHRGVDEVDIGRYQKAKETDFATGCCILIKKEVFEKIGLLDNKYFLYWEDNDFCQRAKKAGFKVCFAPGAVIWHKNASSSGGAGKQTSVYYQTRNRLIFAFKYAPTRAKIAVLKEGIKYLFLGTKWQRRAIKDFLLLKFGPLKK